MSTSVNEENRIFEFQESHLSNCAFQKTFDVIESLRIERFCSRLWRLFVERTLICELDPLVENSNPIPLWLVDEPDYQKGSSRLDCKRGRGPIDRKTLKTSRVFRAESSRMYFSGFEEIGCSTNARWISLFASIITAAFRSWAVRMSGHGVKGCAVNDRMYQWFHRQRKRMKGYCYTQTISKVCNNDANHA